ncbi:MAG: hypothetical protein ACYTF0_00075 [Planctomycetota bacterium]
MAYTVTVDDQRRRVEVCYDGLVSASQIKAQIQEVVSLGEQVRGYREVVRLRPGLRMEAVADDLSSVARRAVGKVELGIKDVRIIVANAGLVPLAAMFAELMREHGMQVSILG